MGGGTASMMCSAIERAGGIVCRCEFGTRKVDGISQWPIDADDTPPIFFVNRAVPGDRQRWTLAHEIAHVVLRHAFFHGREDGFAVPTFVTGFYGMNVPYPGFSRQVGFTSSIAIMVVAAFVLYLVFKRKDWL